ncbi:locomotion-related protein Hikaru genki-like isoform X1 [Ciona intestinalis]
MLALDSYDIGTIITGFQCTDNGAQLVGAHSIQCEDGSWNTTAPTCETRCPRPVAPSNMESPVDLQDFYRVGASVRFLCLHEWDQGSGNAAIECQHDGTWTDNPTCVARCTLPNTPARARIEITNNEQQLYEVGEEITFGCVDSNDEMSGPSQIRCQANRRWSHVVPTCLKRCRGPNPPEGLVLSSGGDVQDFYSFGVTITFQCSDANDEIQGLSSMLCQGNGRWNTALPVCLKRCERSGRFYYVGDSTQRYSCPNADDLLQGSAVSTCLDDRTWSSGVPSCGKL